MDDARVRVALISLVHFDGAHTITQVNVQELGGGYTWLQRYGDAAAVVITRGRLWGACWATGGGAVDLVTRVAFAV